MIDERTCYDVRGYIELLTEACNSVTEPFGLKLQSPPIPVPSLQSYAVIGEGSERITKYYRVYILINIH
jgi:hypothetical protein